MSRKRPKNTRPEAVPQEVDVLAEGSGPNEVIEANPQSLAAAANGLAENRKGRRRKAKAEQARPPAEAPAPDSDSDAAAFDADAPALDAAAGNVLAETGDEEQAVLADAKAASDEALVEEAMLRAEAEAELGAAEAAIDADPGSDEVRAEGALEDAVLRAEAEAELGSPEQAAAEGEVADEELGAALPTTAASMDAAQLKNLVEALVFAADKPVTLQRLRQLTRVSDIKRLEQALAELATDYTSRGIALQQVSGGYQFRTNTQYSVWVQQLIAGRPVRLSRAQLETLAIVAYRQPITRPEIDEIRGVDSSATLRLLLDRALIRTLGKKEDVGRPMLYGTTKEFLDFFSLSDLRELPTLREYSELTAESRKVMSDRLGVDANVEGGSIDDSEVTAAAGPDAPAEPAVEPSTDDVLAAYVAEGDAMDASAAMDAVAAVDSSARPGIEVDPWGQVIGVPDEEPAIADETVEAATSADDDADGEAPRDDEQIEAATSADDEAGTRIESAASAADEASADDEVGTRIEAATSADDDATSVDDEAGRDAERIDAATSVDDEAPRDHEAGRDGERIEAATSLDDEATDEPTNEAADEPTGEMRARDVAELGAPAGGSIEDRLGLSDEHERDREAVSAAASDDGDADEGDANEDDAGEGGAGAQSVATAANDETADRSDDESSHS